MKKRSLTPQEEYTGVAPELNRTTRVRKISPKAWVSAVISLVMSLALFVLYYLAYSGTGNRDKIVLFYCSKRFFPYVSMSNSLSAADFDYDVIDIPENGNTKDNERYKIPDQYSGRQIVVCTFGKDAFKVMDKVAKANDGKIAGYCLVNPEYPGEEALEGYGRYYPKVPVAIFGNEAQSAKAGKDGGPNMLYEKLSGADTLYGVPAVNGTLIKSKVWISPDQSRYMSQSSMAMGNHVIRYSPLFETELARYLGITYGSGVSTIRLKAWFICAPFTAFAALCFLALFVFIIPVRESDKGSKELKGRDSLGTIIFFGLSAWIGLTMCVMTFIPDLAGYVRYGVVLAPAALTAAMALLRVPYLLSKKIAYKRDKLQRNAVIVPLVMALCEIVFVVSLVLTFTDITGIDQGTKKLAVALITFIVSCLSAFALARADRKSRFAGEGPASYFGNPVYFIETVIPPAAVLVLSIVRSDSSLICYSSMALACGILPFVSAVTIKRFSDYFEAAGVAYGILMGILVFIAL